MNPDQAYKEKTIQRLALKIADSLENGQISKEQAAEISSYILENIDKTNNNAELFTFLEDLATKWPMFSNLATSEDIKVGGEIAEAVKQEKVEEIGDLIKENKIDEALKVATDANTSDVNTGGGS